MILTQEKNSEITNLVVDCYKYSKASFETYYSLCQTLQDIYAAQLPAEIGADLAEENPGLMSPDIYLAANDAVAGLSKVLFSAKPYYLCKATMNGTPQNARFATSYLDFAVDKSKLKLEYAKSLSSAVKFGIGVGVVELGEFEELVAQQNPMQGFSFMVGSNGGQPGQFFGRSKINLPKYTHCNIKRFFPDPCFPKPAWVIFQTQTTYLDLLKDKAEGRYDFDEKELEKISSSFPISDYYEFFPKENFKSSIMRDKNFPIELLQFRGYLPIFELEGKNYFMDVIITVANRTLIVQFDENLWHYPAVESFIYTYLFPDDQECSFPIGKTEVSMDSYLQQFYLRNQRLMNLDAILNPQYWTDSKDLPDYLPTERGRVHKVSAGANFQPILLKDISEKAYLEVDIMKNEIKWVYGSNQYTAGEDPRRKETAFGIGVLKGATDLQREFETEIAIESGFKQIGRRYLDIGQAYLPHVPIKLFDSDEMVVIGKENIFGDFEIAVDKNEAFNKPMKQQQAIQAVSIFRGDPDVDQVELKRRFFKTMDEEDIDKLVPESAVKMLPIEKENMLMVQMGVFVPVLPREPHPLHIAGHQQFAQHPIVAQHLQQHIEIMKSMMPQAGGSAPVTNAPPDPLKQMLQSLQPKSFMPR